MVIIASAAAPPLLYGLWLLARVFLTNYFTIPTESMCPTLQRHQFRHDYYFMAGDNVVNSADSRYWRLVPEEYVIGVMEWAVRDKKIKDMAQAIFMIVIMPTVALIRMSSCHFISTRYKKSKILCAFGFYSYICGENIKRHTSIPRCIRLKQDT